MGSVLKIQRGGESPQVTYAKYNYTVSYTLNQKYMTIRKGSLTSIHVYHARSYSINQTNGYFAMNASEKTGYNDDFDGKYISFANPIGHDPINSGTLWFSSIYEVTHVYYYTTGPEMVGYHLTSVQNIKLGTLVGYVAGKLGEYPTDGPHTDGYYYKLLVTS